MNDLERTRLFLDSLDVTWEEEPGDLPDSLALRLTSEGREDNRVVGYSYFFAEFVFDCDGAFVHIGIWE